MSASALSFSVYSDNDGTDILWEYHSVTAHDELLALCAEMHAEGAKLTYDSIRARRGGGSRRDISRALLGWHQQRARDLSAVATDLSEDVERLGAEFVRSLWSAMAKKVADKLQEVKAETQELCPKVGDGVIRRRFEVA